MPSIITGIVLTTANDAPERDPASITIRGSIDGITFTDIVNEKPTPLPSERLKRTFFEINNTDVYEMHYPVLQYPMKIKSLKLDKFPVIKGKLVGIKGQYLIFDDGSVFNVRNHEGYVVNLKV